MTRAVGVGWRRVGSFLWFFFDKFFPFWVPNFHGSVFLLGNPEETQKQTKLVGGSDWMQKCKKRDSAGPLRRWRPSSQTLSSEHP